MASRLPGTMPPVPELIRQIGQHLQEQIAQGAQEVKIPSTMKDIIGQAGIEELLTKYCKFAGEDASSFVVGNMMYICAARRMRDISYGVSTPTVEKKTKVPRPPNAFILYRQHHHPGLKKAHPEMHNNEISTILGAQWRHESTETKAGFTRLAQLLKAEHLKAHPDYMYKPRKSSEKKRRMSPKKAQKLQAIAASLFDNEIQPVNLATNVQSSGEVYDYSDCDEFANNGRHDVVLLGDPEFDGEKLTAMLQSRKETNVTGTGSEDLVTVHPRDHGIIACPTYSVQQSPASVVAESNAYKNFDQFLLDRRVTKLNDDCEKGSKIFLTINPMVVVSYADRMREKAWFNTAHETAALHRALDRFNRTSRP